MKRCFLGAMALAVLWLAGCAAPREYRPAAGTPTARLNLQGLGDKRICADGLWHAPVKEGDGYAAIPAGRRVIVRASHSETHYNAVFNTRVRCEASASIVPAPGQKYLVDYEFHTDRCYLMIFKEDASKRTGLVMEPTLAAAPACKTP